jgi:hypothetical protein
MRSFVLAASKCMPLPSSNASFEFFVKQRFFVNKSMQSVSARVDARKKARTRRALG